MPKKIKTPDNSGEHENRMLQSDYSVKLPLSAMCRRALASASFPWA